MNPIDVAPNQPIAFGGTGFEDRIILSWSPNKEWDLSGYNLHRSTIPNFSPDNRNLLSIISETDSVYVDSLISPGTLYYYTINAYDLSGNESSFSPQAAIYPSANRYSLQFSNNSLNQQYGRIIIGNDNLVDSLGIEMWFQSDQESGLCFIRKMVQEMTNLS